MEASKSSITWAEFIIKIICIKHNLVILKLMPFYTLASLVLMLLETFLQVLFLYGCEPCCCSMLNFFYESNMKTFSPLLNLEKNREVPQRIWCLGDGWTLVLHQKLLQCEGSLAVYIFMVQDWIISPVFFQMSSFKFSELWYKKWNPLFVLQGQIYVAPLPSCLKCNQYDLLRYCDPWPLFSGQCIGVSFRGLTFHLRIID